MGWGCKGICNRFKPSWGKGSGRGMHTPRYTENTCWCRTCNIWLDKVKGIENFRCICCHGKVRLLARTNWRNKKLARY